MSLDEISVSISVESANKTNLDNVRNALKDIKKLDKELDLSSFKEGIAKINWSQVLKGSGIDDIGKRAEEIYQVITEALGRLRTIEDALQANGELKDLEDNLKQHCQDYLNALKEECTKKFDSVKRAMTSYKKDLEGMQESILVLKDEVKQTIKEKMDAIKESGDKAAEQVKSITEKMEAIQTHMTSTQEQLTTMSTQWEGVFKIMEDSEKINHTQTIMDMRKMFNDMLVNFKAAIPKFPVGLDELPKKLEDCCRETNQFLNTINENLRRMGEVQTNQSVWMSTNAEKIDSILTKVSAVPQKDEEVKIDFTPVKSHVTRRVNDAVTTITQVVETNMADMKRELDGLKTKPGEPGEGGPSLEKLVSMSSSQQQMHSETMKSIDESKDILLVAIDAVKQEVSKLPKPAEKRPGGRKKGSGKKGRRGRASSTTKASESLEDGFGEDEDVDQESTVIDKDDV